MTQMAAGLGLLPGTVIDQHFEQRNRYGRLLMIVAQSPQLLGMGVDEDTAAVVQGNVLSVVGRGAVTILDPSNITTNAFDAKRSAPLLASGVVLHVLPQGARFDLAARQLLPFEAAVDPREAAEIEEAGRDLRQMAGDIAAGDASPSVLRRRLRRTRKRDGDPA
jgi:cyanophycinase